MFLQCFYRVDTSTADERFFNNPDYGTTVLSEPHQYSLDGPHDTPLSSGTQPPDAIYDAVTEASDVKDHVQEVGGVGLYSTYDVIATEENISTNCKDGNHTVKEEAAPYEVASCSVVARTHRESNHAEEGKAALYSTIVEPQNISISTDAVEYSKLHH